MERVASKPVLTGICRSIKTTPYEPAQNFSTAICPFSAGSMWHSKSRKYSATRKRFFGRIIGNQHPDACQRIGGLRPVGILRSRREARSVADPDSPNLAVKWKVDPRPRLAFHPQPSVHHMNQALRNGQTQPRSSILARGGSIRLGGRLRSGIQFCPPEFRCPYRTRKNAGKRGGVAGSVSTRRSMRPCSVNLMAFAQQIQSSSPK